MNRHERSRNYSLRCLRLTLVGAIGAIVWTMGLLTGPIQAQIPAKQINYFGPSTPSAFQQPNDESNFDGGAEENGDSAEEADEIETDRDSFTPATSTAGASRTILESAYSFTDNRDTFELHSFPELLWRKGLTDRLELRFGWNYEVGGGSESVSGTSPVLEEENSTLEHESRISYGLKFNFNEQHGWQPAAAGIIQGFTPTGGESDSSSLVATYVFGWEFPNRIQLDAAARYGLGSESGSTIDQWAPSIALKTPMGNRWKGHIEYFGVNANRPNADRFVNYISPGVHYLVTPDVEIGVRFGWGLNDESANFFNNVGIGLRF